jgi:hypothetical protein
MLNTNMAKYAPPVSANPVHYLRGHYQMRQAANELKEVTGYNLPDRPKLEIHNVPDSETVAQVHSRRLIVWDPKTALRTRGDAIPHEIYHYGQDSFRSGMGDHEAELRYVMKASSDQNSANIASALWNGTNEAGAYLFGFQSELKYFFNGDELAKNILLKLQNHVNGPSLEKSKYTALDLIFAPDGIDADPSKTETIKAFGRITTLIVAAIVLDQNGFDVSETAKDFLHAPDVILKRIKALGYNGALASINRAEEFIKK